MGGAGVAAGTDRSVIASFSQKSMQSLAAGVNNAKEAGTTAHERRNRRASVVRNGQTHRHGAEKKGDPLA